MYMASNRLLTQVRLFVKRSCEDQTKFFRRSLSSSEVSVALRPFYFAVHPDLFEQHPKERDVNENSLKHLNNYIQTILHQKPVMPAKLKFYLRNSSKSSKQLPADSGVFQSVNIFLGQQKDIRGALQSILSSCSLSTQYVDSLPTPPPHFKQKKPIQYQDKKWTTDETWEEAFFKKKKDMQEETLSHWIKCYSNDAAERSRACQPVREEINRLQEEICNHLGLADLLWDCGWGTSHFRGCLLSFQTLATHHPEEMGLLKGRTVIFGNESGLSLQGHVILNSGEVRHNWLDLIRNLDRYEIPLSRVPSLEAALSRSFCDIKVAQRLYRPELLAETYESHLKSLTTSIGDYRGRHSFPRDFPESLSNYHLVVEAEAGPLMLSPSGQFITPSSCPVSLLIGFISANLKEARIRLDQYEAHLQKENDLMASCINTFDLSALGKDDNVTPTQMAACCQALLAERDSLRPHIQNGRLWITHYYSLLSDGEMCIPWNWK